MGTSTEHGSLLAMKAIAGALSHQGMLPQQALWRVHWGLGSLNLPLFFLIFPVVR